MLFIPGGRPPEMFDRKAHGVRLFVKRVFIMEDCEELLPQWLRFMRGVVDSEDLPLNVSRELLQQDKTSRFIQKQVVIRTLSLLEELAVEGETTVKGEDGEETKVHRYRIQGTLSAGEHVLAISLHNHGSGSSDLRIAGITLLELEPDDEP